VLFAVTFAGGATVTFLPIERPDGVLATVALLLYGIASALGRWCAGVLGDRIGNRLLLPATVLLTAVGLAVLATGLAAGAPVVLGAGAAVLGAGYGAVQSLTLMAAFDRAGDGGATTASAFWNAAFDAGTGVGAVALGPVAASIGLPWGLTLVSVLLAALLPVSRLATRPRLR
jgi:predicted MFS family arabinose efflux permease